MLIGEAPTAAEEDLEGKAFVGADGELLDKIFAAIDLYRAAEDAESSGYLSHILNWRPPGNRSPNQGEIGVSLPLIEKHIMLVKPKILILCGSITAKTLLGRSESISRLRGSWHDYKPQTAELGYEGNAIPAIATYHPSYLLSTPLQKRAAWQDFLSVKSKLREL